MDTSQLKIVTRKELEDQTRLYQNYLNFDGDKFALLMAIAGAESSFGAQCTPRYEYDYGTNSLAYKRSRLLQQGHLMYGDLASCSYGCHQILWVVAAELGFDVNIYPCELTRPEVSLPFTIKLINKLILSGAKTVEDLAVCYNGGLGALKVPTADEMKYAKKVRNNYDALAPK